MLSADIALTYSQQIIYFDAALISVKNSFFLPNPSLRITTSLQTSDDSFLIIGLISGEIILYNKHTYELSYSNLS